MEKILRYLNEECLFELNNTNVWNAFTSKFPNIKCDDTTNTPDVIDRNCLRFTYDNSLYEYIGPNTVVLIDEK